MGSAETKCRVLLLESRADDAAQISGLLGDNVAVTQRATLAEATRMAQQHAYDVAITAASLPDAPHASAVRKLAAMWQFPVILLADEEAPEVGDDALRFGAQDYLVKGRFRETELARAISASIERYEALAQYRRLLDKCPDGVLIVSQTGVVLLANPSAIAAFGSPLVGATFELPLANEPTEISILDGGTAEMRVTSVPWQGAPAHLVMLRDVSTRVSVVARLRELNATLERLAIVDPLTQVLNRRGMEGGLAEVMICARCSGTPTTALLIDCDDFKSINESGGYAAGDAALQLVAQTLTSCVRSSYDRVGRIGGDEFLVLLPDTTKAEALLIAERIRAAIHAAPLPLWNNRAQENITVSLGMSSVPPTISSLHEVVALAHGRLLESKQAGKDQVSAGISGDLPAQGELKVDVHELIRRPGAISVAAQPIVRTGSGAVVGYELLIRGPSGDPLESPSSLFSSARSEKVLPAADLMCLRRCIEACKRLPVMPLDLNIYPSTLMDTPIEEIVEILRGASSHPLVLELNEQELIGDPKLIVPRLRTLKAAGVRIGLDDVGFGRSAFETLLTVEPDAVKVDRSAVHGLAKSHEQRQVLKRMLGCLRSLDAQIIAEGVEVEEDARIIEDMGIDLAQGFLWGRPETILPAEAWAEEG